MLRLLIIGRAKEIIMPKINKKQLIIQALDFNRCLTNRELSEITGIDRETLCAPLLGMVDTGLLERDKRKRSPINNRAVYAYRHKNEREQNGCQ